MRLGSTGQNTRMLSLKQLGDDEKGHHEVDGVDGGTNETDLLKDGDHDVNEVDGVEAREEAGQGDQAEEGLGLDNGCKQEERESTAVHSGTSVSSVSMRVLIEQRLHNNYTGGVDSVEVYSVELVTRQSRAPHSCGRVHVRVWV